MTVLGRTYHLWPSGPLAENRKPKSWEFSADARGRWYVNIQVALPDPQKRNAPSVGIDLGLNSVVALSNGFKIAAPRFYRQEEEQLGAFEQRGQKVRARALAAKIANRRRHFLHVMSHGIVQQYAEIYVADVSPTAGKDADGEVRPRCRLGDAPFDAPVQSDCAGSKMRNRLRTIQFPGLLVLRDDLPQ